MRSFLFKTKKEAKSKERGFTIVETLIAISVFSFSLLAFMAVLSQGTSDINYAKKKIEATYLAQEGIEHVRNMRDNDILFTSYTGLTWNDFKAANKNYPSTNPNFVRTIQMVPVASDPNEVKILCTVSWTQGSGNYSVTLSEELFNWVE